MGIRKSIFRNSFWFGLESIIDSAVNLAISAVVARVIGPVGLGAFIFLMFLINQGGRLGGFGPGAATRKYLAEYLGRGDQGMARNVFFMMLRWHVELGLAFAAIGWLLTFAVGDPAQYVVSSILVASMIASVINTVPSQANMAAENFARNVPASLVSIALYVAVVVLALTLGWGVPGLAVAVLLRRTVEMLMRLVPAVAWARQMPIAPVPPQMARKLIAFSGQSLGIALLLMVVWDRSELLFLKHFCAIQEVTYYSVAFSVTEALLLLPNVIGAAVTARLMADHGRFQGRIGPLASSSIRYIALLVVPMYIGLAALSDAVVRVVYGPAYLPAIPVLAIALLLAVPKAFYWFPSAALQAADRQGIMFRCLLVVAVLNAGLDLILIPRFGALGAALGNGVAQSAAVVVLMVTAGRVCGVQLPWRSLGKTLSIAGVMGAVVYLGVQSLPPAAALVCGPILGALVYLALLRLTNAFTPEDLAIVGQFESRIPLALRGVCGTLLKWVAGSPGAACIAPVELVASKAEAGN